MRVTAPAKVYAFKLYPADPGDTRWMVYPGVIVPNLLADRRADRKGLLRGACRSALFRERGIATQRSIARDIIDRSRRFPEFTSAELTSSI
jgi:hypothetical protein